MDRAITGGAVAACHALALLVLLAIASTAAAATLVRGIGPEPATLDPQRAQDLASFNVLFELYEGLVSETADGQPAPGLAEHWHADADGLGWTFVLREGLRFSDGSVLGIDDVVASLRRVFDPATAAPYAGKLVAIRGAAAVLAGRAPAATLGVQALDPRTLRVELQAPLPQLPQLLMLPVAFPVHAELRAGGRPDRVPTPGAFVLRARVPQSQLLLEANPHYHAAGSVALAAQRLVITEDAHAELNRFRTGELHVTETIPPGHYATLRAEFGEQLQVAPYLGSHFIGYNLTRPPFAGNPALREALALAIDRDILVDHITGAGELPAYRLVPPLPGWPVDPASDGLDADARRALARRRFAESGYAGGPLRVQIRFNSNPLQRRLALAVAAMWRQQLGIATELHNEEWRVFVVNRRERRLTQAFRGGWIADYADPTSFLDLFAGDGALNWSGWSDPDYDRLLAAAQRTPEPAARLQLLRTAEQRLLDAQPIIPLYFHVSRHLVSPQVQGWTAHPLDRHFGRHLRLRTGPAGR
jgi:oligopeptide transport system substrate-binding protein